ncbi:hypothetical protein HOY82DRAFT_32326 [Tuber indicum]|nr:hypothetical protein HOY82DRAFT_32326 [Tuber indicum]
MSLIRQLYSCKGTISRVLALILTGNWAQLAFHGVYCQPEYTTNPPRPVSNSHDITYHFHAAPLIIIPNNPPRRSLRLTYTHEFYRNQVLSPHHSHSPACLPTNRLFCMVYHSSPAGKPASQLVSWFANLAMIPLHNHHAKTE